MKHLFFLFIFCLSTFSTAQARLNVVASTPMMHSFASQIYGNPSKIKILSCASNDCQQDLSTNDISHLKKAQLIVWLGTEKAVAQWLKENPQAVSYAVLTQTTDLEVLPSPIDSKENNPYVWLSPQNAIAIITELSKRLSQQDPKNAARYARNLEQYTDRWSFFDGYKLPTIDATYPPLVSLQEGLEYLFDYLGLTDVQTFPVDSRRADYMVSDKTLAGKIKQANPVCVFVGPYVSKQTLDQLNLPKGIKVVHVDIEGNPKKSGPYLYRHVMRTLFLDVYNCLGIPLPRRKR